MAEKRFPVQHMACDNHMQAVQISNKNMCEYYCRNVHLKVEIDNQILSDICVMLWCLQILHLALNFDELKIFLEVNCGRCIPDECSLAEN
jgi:hypothetical protein